MYETFPKADALKSFGKAILEVSISGHDGFFHRDEPNHELAKLLSTPSLIDHSYPVNVFNTAEGELEKLSIKSSQNRAMT